MAILHLMVGVQGSGKSTYSNKLNKDYGYKIISSDEVRKMHPNWEEIRVFPEVYRLCAIELKEGRDVIFDATNITPKVRSKNIGLIRDIYSDFEVHAYFIKASKETCKERVKRRNIIEGELYLPIEVIDSYFNNLVIPSVEEGFDKIIIINND